MFRILLTIAMLVTLITPKAHGSAAHGHAFAEPAPDQSTPTLGTIPAQVVAICCELELDLSTFVTGTIGMLEFTAESSNTELVTVSVSENMLTIAGAGEGEVNVTVYLGTGMSTTASTAFHVTVTAGSPWSVSGTGNVYRLDGNVGIGVDDPDERLVVDGRIKAEEIHLDAITPADYVFDEDYDLISLNELKAHVQNHGHLPGIAPGAEMEAEGVSVGRMQTRLLEKVEELMLYTIDQHRTLSSQRKVIDEQERQLALQQRYIESLEKRLSKLETDR
ncbi:MAG: hypothetical protein OXG98_04425 [Gemmatimonadetes bacterium]|nr:hypothetical protein [Gemmatimonadota bacterium]